MNPRGYECCIDYKLERDHKRGAECGGVGGQPSMWQESRKEAVWVEKNQQQQMPQWDLILSLYASF